MKHAKRVYEIENLRAKRQVFCISLGEAWTETLEFQALSGERCPSSSQIYTERPGPGSVPADMIGPCAHANFENPQPLALHIEAGETRNKWLLPVSLELQLFKERPAIPVGNSAGTAWFGFPVGTDLIE